MLEKNLTEKIHLCYDRELEKARAQLKDIKTQFSEYQEGIAAKIKAMVRQQVNSIDNVMQSEASRYQNLSKKTGRQLEKEKYEDQVKRMSTKHRQNPVQLESQTNKKDPKRQAGDVPAGHSEDAFLQSITLKKQRDELESLKMNEKEARESVLRLQELLRKQRILHKMRDVAVHEKHLLDVEHLKK